MKTRNIIFVLSFILFNSCIVKSLNPFYTKETISFKKELVGNWTDQNNGKWKVIAFKDAEKSDSPTEEEKRLREKYSESYYVEYEKKGTKSIFFVTPFKIKNQYFLDFIPFDIENETSNSLVRNHMVTAHSLVKLDVLKNGEIEIKWFDSDELKKLFQENRIKIKHEKTGAMEDEVLLTASSKEIQKFLKKYLTTESAKKWETSTKYTLTKS